MNLKMRDASTGDAVHAIQGTFTHQINAHNLGVAQVQSLRLGASMQPNLLSLPNTMGICLALFRQVGSEFAPSGDSNQLAPIDFGACIATHTVAMAAIAWSLAHTWSDGPIARAILNLHADHGRYIV